MRLRPRLILVALLPAVLLVVVIVGLRQVPSTQQPKQLSLHAQLDAVAGAPAPLAALHDQADRLLPGGVDALQQRLRALRGHPVVVNYWASWCGPCGAEGVIFQHVAAQDGRRVAFVGVDSHDSDAGARTALRKTPLSYPSYTDPSQREARRLHLLGYPDTLLIDSNGHATLHQGQYSTVAQLLRAVSALR